MSLQDIAEIDLLFKNSAGRIGDRVYGIVGWARRDYSAEYVSR
jgi:hypothetical protein